MYFFLCWVTFFLKFAEKASGIVRVMVNGTRMESGKPIPAFRNNRYFVNECFNLTLSLLNIVNAPDLCPCLEASTT